METQLTNKEKNLLFWASFISLAAAGFGFAFRIAHMGTYGAEFGLTGLQVGTIAGSCFWPIAITMIHMGVEWTYDVSRPDERSFQR